MWASCSSICQKNIVRSEQNAVSIVQKNLFPHKKQSNIDNRLFGSIAVHGKILLVTNAFCIITRFLDPAAQFFSQFLEGKEQWLKRTLATNVVCYTKLYIVSFNRNEFLKKLNYA